MSAPEAAPGLLVETSADVRAAVLLNSAGGFVASSGAGSTESARELARLAYDLVVAADTVAAAPTTAVEAQTGPGAVFAVRDARWMLVCVARRLALSSLVLYDLRQALLGLR